MAGQFNFKHFSVKHDVNSHKLGTDSMLLGAWTKTDANRILDIGTGTGVLALMMAQNHPEANITAIEIDAQNIKEAKENFSNSKYSKRILPIQTAIQDFATIEKYDLIICNPPYYNGSALSDQDNRNVARQGTELQTHELYESVSELLDQDGRFNLIFPIEQELEHLRWAAEYDLHPTKILRTLNPKGRHKRCLFSFGFDAELKSEDEMEVINSEFVYSRRYVEMTREYHDRDLEYYD